MVVVVAAGPAVRAPRAASFAALPPAPLLSPFRTFSRLRRPPTRRRRRQRLQRGVVRAQVEQRCLHFLEISVGRGEGSGDRHDPSERLGVGALAGADAEGA